MNNFYVYSLLDPRKPGKYSINEYCSLLFEPFYIGYSGSKRRFNGHLKEAKEYSNRCTRKLSKIRKLLKLDLLPLELKIFTNLSKVEAINLEIYLINLIGQVCLKTGTLANEKPGGFGGSNKGWKHSEDAKKRIGNASKGRKLIFSDEHKNKISKSSKGRIAWNKGKKWSKEVKQKLGKKGKIPWNKGVEGYSTKRKGQKHSEEAKTKISKSNQGKLNGRVPWNKGVKGYSIKRKDKYSEN